MDDPFDALDRLDAERGWPMHFDRDGMPISTREYMAKFADPDYKRVALTHFASITISTVWLGLNHNWQPNGPPLIFETMLFCDLDEPVYAFGRVVTRDEAGCWRWSTEAEALEGHQQIVESVRMPDSLAELQPQEGDE